MEMAELAGAVAQFGVAGLIGWMWLAERRGSAQRERELSEAHERLVAQRTELAALLDVVAANTRALEAVRAGQAELGRLIARRVREGRAAG